MAGTRQHFIPRFLLEGFASHRVGGNTYTWVYRKETAPFNANIINVGVETKFYTTDLDTTADDLITAAEGEFGALINALRSGSVAQLRDPQLPALIAHLEVRTRHLRESYLQTGELLLSKMLAFLSDEEAFPSYVIRLLQNDPSILRNSFAEEFAKRGMVSDNFLDRVVSLVSPHIPALIKHQQDEFSILASKLREAAPTMLRNAAKSGHIKALKNAIAPTPRVQRYERLSYRIDKPQLVKPLILGDSIVLFSIEGARKFKPTVDGADVLNAVFLPLDSETVLIGSTEEKFGNVPNEELPDAIAQCSLEYFIAAENSPINDEMKTLIGQNAHLLEQSELEIILSELIHDGVAGTPFH